MDDINRFLQEDLGKDGDITSNTLFTNECTTAAITSHENCIVAGLEEASEVFRRTGARSSLLINDGDFVKAKTDVAEISGPVKAILSGERLALNFLGRMSGIATETRKLVELCRKINPAVTIAATRKTTPGFRKYEKKAVVLGGGESHRQGLFDAVMIKDNHLRCVGSLEDAIRSVKDTIRDKIVEIEVENEHDALLAAHLAVDVVMLDNFDVASAKVTFKKIKEINPKILVEISGGITPENISDYAVCADRISLGYLTHSVSNKDFSLDIK